MADESKCGVIVIDDEEDVRESLKQLFTLEGFEVYAMANAKEALRFISTKFQGVIISDIRMPEMDGLTFLKEVRKFNKLLPVILITGHGDIKLAVKSLKLGATDFLEKPFNPNELVSQVKVLSSQRQNVIESYKGFENSSLKKMTDDFEKSRICYSLEKHEGSILSVMKELKLPRRTLNEKMVKYKINRQSFIS
tara:strand:- start:2309 stop:2890 length:582 start_codon:yes stop_codon:yes gene_type:complete